MINLAVVNIKDIIKYLVGIILAVVAVISLTRYFSNHKQDKTNISMKQIVEKIEDKSLLSCMDTALPIIKLVNDKNKGIADDIVLMEEQKSPLIRLLDMQLAMLDSAKETKTEETSVASSQQPVEESTSEEKPIEEAKTGLNTTIIEENNTANNKYNDTFGSVKIKNESDHVITQEMLTPDVIVNTKNIVLFHTHTCESYTPTEQYSYQQTGTYRTTDLNYSVARVGTELTSYLENYGYHVIHDTTYHDYPAYNGSYNRSLTTVSNILASQPDADIVIDLHRDAVGDNTYAPKVKIGEEQVAQLMFVIGTDGGGLEHNNWNQNLKFAVKVVEKANELYPGLFKPIMIRNSRYNQQVAKAASIIEVGATGNTLEECLGSMKYLSKVLNEVLKE